MNISDLIKVDPEEKVFLDTNILIFLFSPSFVTSASWQIDKYSQIFAKLVENKNEMYINSLVVSEFINRCLRIDFDKNYNNDNKDFKRDYRQSSEYEQTLKVILNELKKILALTITIDDDFSSFNVISEFKNNSQLDFNDLIIARTVINNGFSLLSDDQDFDHYEGIKKLHF